MHNDELSLLRALDNTLGLSVFGNDASGQLFMDDGWSTETDYRYIEFSFDGTNLDVTTTHSSYATSKALTDLVFYGVNLEPAQVTSDYCSNGVCTT